MMGVEAWSKGEVFRQWSFGISSSNLSTWTSVKTETENWNRKNKKGVSPT